VTIPLPPDNEKTKKFLPNASSLFGESVRAHFDKLERHVVTVRDVIVDVDVVVVVVVVDADATVSGFRTFPGLLLFGLAAFGQFLRQIRTKGGQGIDGGLVGATSVDEMYHAAQMFFHETLKDK
jgi:hypothetical protein